MNKRIAKKKYKKAVEIIKNPKAHGLKCNQAADATGLLRFMRRMDGNCRKKVGKDRQ